LRKSLLLAFSLLALPLLAADEDIKLDSSTLGGLRARSIGPAVMGGRIAAMDAHAPADAPMTVYVGAASGGVWKSTDSGTSFKPVFDEHTQSIGAIAIDKSNPQTVWVGTGESWVRNSVSVGTGVYKSTDGGASWSNAGLGDSEHIARISVHPKKSDTVYVCATGHAWCTSCGTPWRAMRPTPRRPTPCASAGSRPRYALFFLFSRLVWESFSVGWFRIFSLFRTVQYRFSFFVS
jgi:hypothetical protein